MNRPEKALLGSLALTALTVPAMAAPPANFWNSPTDYSYGINSIPDFDQQRTGLPPVAPPGPGAMYCGPTTGTDLYVFMGDHGYPALLPGELNQNWQDPAKFVSGTNKIFAMGNLMGCSPTGGTSLQGFTNGLRAAIGNQPITISSYAAYGSYSPNLNQIAATGLNNGLMGLAYGYYTVAGFVYGNVPVVVRGGGHFVAVSGARRVNNLGYLWVRDPANEQPPIYPTQSAFADGLYQIDTGWVLVAQPPFAPVFRWVSRMNPGAPTVPTVGATLRLIDAIGYAKPRNVLGRGPNGQVVVIRPAANWAGANFENVNSMVCEPLDFGDTAVDIASAPDMNGAVVIAADNGGIASGRGGNIELVDAFTGGVLIIGQVDGAQKITVGRNRSAYMISNGTTLTSLPVPVGAEEAEPDGATPPPPATMTLPHAAQALTYDDANDQVVLISFTDGKVMRVAADLSGRASEVSIPARVTLGATGSVTIHPTTGDVWITTAGSSSIVALSNTRDRRGTATATIVTAEGVTAPTSVDFLIDGHMTVADADHLVELEPTADPTVWDHFDNPMWDSLACPIVEILVDDDRSNFVPGYHDTPDWNNIDPPQLDPGIVMPDPPCFGDLNADGVVDGQDLALLLGAWGPGNVGNPADLDGDAVVDGADLGYLLAHWGPCPNM